MSTVSDSMTPVSPPISSSARTGRRWRIPLILLTLFILAVIAVGAIFWWLNRPIKATVLAEPEKAVLEEKLARLEEPEGATPSEPGTPDYQPGEKLIVLTERELNGLLHDNTGMGDQLKLELAKDAVHARISADIPEDFPIMSGKKLKGKARFLVKDTSGNPALILEDLTIWGISLPNAWLGDLKGKNLLGELLGKSPSGGIAGIRNLVVEQDELRIELDD
ncbi:MAG: hypothetical protein Q7Q71_15645 [Verrucomicrobiota bacterium JB023]|nr:hypothetical protein [Verrucomicrobiota bacterium JB023]